MSEWSSRLVEAITARVADLVDRPSALLVRPIGVDAVEIVFSGFDGDERHGMRVAQRDLAAVTGLLAGRSTEELAFYLTYAFILEPRAIEGFEPPDASGIRWLPFSTWIADLT